MNFIVNYLFLFKNLKAKEASEYHISCGYINTIGWTSRGMENHDDKMDVTNYSDNVLQETPRTLVI